MVFRSGDNRGIPFPNGIIECWRLLSAVPARDFCQRISHSNRYRDDLGGDFQFEATADDMQVLGITRVRDIIRFEQGTSRCSMSFSMMKLAMRFQSQGQEPVTRLK